MIRSEVVWGSDCLIRKTGCFVLFFSWYVLQIESFSLVSPQRNSLRHTPLSRRACLNQRMVLEQGSQVFEARPPPLEVTLPVVLSTLGTMSYWWFVLVPSERRDLAKNKNKVR